MGRWPVRLVLDTQALIWTVEQADTHRLGEHGLLAGGFEAEHRDPVDRIIVAQAIVEGALLVTADPAMQAFDVDIVW